MQPINPYMSDIEQRVQAVVERINAWYSSHGIDPKADYPKGAVWINFTLGAEYYFAAQKLLIEGNILGATVNLRSSLENTADIFFITGEANKLERRSRAYVESIDAYREAMSALGDSPLEEGGGNLVERVNPWTTSTIATRLQATGDSLTLIYNLMSYYSHPNPAAMFLLTNPAYKAAQTEVLRQGNVISILNAVGVLLTYETSIDTVTHKELNEIAAMLGIRLIR